METARKKHHFDLAQDGSTPDRLGSGPLDTRIAECFNLLYEDLRTLASSYMRREPSGHTLQTTALVHEAYLRMKAQTAPGWRDRKGFFAASATVMRRLLVDYARARKTARRSPAPPPALEQVVTQLERSGDGLEELDGALSRLAKIDPLKVAIAELRFFVGLSVDETARLLDLSPRTVAREWSFARTWLRSEIDRPRSSATNRPPRTGAIPPRGDA